MAVGKANLILRWPPLGTGLQGAAGGDCEDATAGELPAFVNVVVPGCRTTGADWSCPVAATVVRVTSLVATAVTVAGSRLKSDTEARPIAGH